MSDPGLFDQENDPWLEMAMHPMNLFTLDVLPPHCSIESLMGHDEEGRPILCFRATRHRRWRRDRSSDWSGVFLYEGEPIQLAWDAFWSEP